MMQTVTDRRQWGWWHYCEGGWVIGRESAGGPDWVLLLGPTHEETVDYEPSCRFDEWHPIAEGEFDLRPPSREGDRTEWGWWHRMGGGWALGRLLADEPRLVLLHEAGKRDSLDYEPVSAFDDWRRVTWVPS